MAGVEHIECAPVEVEAELFYLGVDLEDVRDLGVEDDPFLLFAHGDLYVMVVGAVDDQVETDFDYFDCGFVVLVEEDAEVGVD